MASQRGVEPPACRLGGGCSIQLSYWDIVGAHSISLAVLWVLERRGFVSKLITRFKMEFNAKSYANLNKNDLHYQ